MKGIQGDRQPNLKRGAYLAESCRVWVPQRARGSEGPHLPDFSLFSATVTQVGQSKRSPCSRMRQSGFSVLPGLGRSPHRQFAQQLQLWVHSMTLQAQIESSS